jgi:hypothetical protein
MRTPGGHLRVDRGDVERLATNASPPPDQPAESESEETAIPESEDAPSRPTQRRSWEGIPPWKQRVREAEADVEVLGLDDKKDRIIEAREERTAARQRAQEDRQRQAEEEARLRQLKTQASWYVGFDVPADVRAEVMREIERFVTSDRYPRSLNSVTTAIMLKADVDRCLVPFRSRQAEATRLAREPQLREIAILSAVTLALRRMPDDWDTRMRMAFERDCRRAVAKKYQPGMDQQDANDVAQDVLDLWLDEDDAFEDDTDEDEDDFLDDEDDYEDEDDGDDW